MKGKSFLFWLFLMLSIFFTYNHFFPPNKNVSSVPFSEFMNKVEAGDIVSVDMQLDTVAATTKNGSKITSDINPFYSEKIIDKLREKNVNIKVVIPSKSGGSRLGGFLIALLNWLPMIIFLGIWIFMLRQVNTNNPAKGFGFGKNKARMLMEKDLKITFDDVAGIDEAKSELIEVVDFLRNPQKYQKVGGKIPKGCLLVGTPGSGKTLLAKAIAGEAKVPFFFISGSDFVEMFVGVGASRVREMFQQAKKQAPCIIFIDEIDAVGRHRGIGLGGGNDEREQTLNQLLVEMDGFEDSGGVIVVAATNRPDVLDPALLRPGRFDRQVVVGLPDVRGREQILAVHARKVKLAPSVNLNEIARGTPGFSGADLANLINEGALYAAKSDRKLIVQEDLEYAKDKVMMGAERKSMVMKDEERKLTAYHEGGHAVVAINLPESDPIHKATIIPRGRALGMVMRLPEGDRLSVTRAKMKADIAVAMGGRVAEELVFGYDKVTSGASSDIEQATKMARAMVTQWGLSDVVGPINHADAMRDRYLSGGDSGAVHASEKTMELIDSEIKKIVQDGYDLAKKILTEKRNDLDVLANALLGHECLTGEEITDILNGKDVIKNQVQAVKKRPSYI